jgi:hypothetical protein
MKYSNGNDIKAKRSESFDNGVFFDIEAKQTHLIVRKLFFEAKSIVSSL